MVRPVAGKAGAKTPTPNPTVLLMGERGSYLRCGLSPQRRIDFLEQKTSRLGQARQRIGMAARGGLGRKHSARGIIGQNRQPAIGSIPDFTPRDDSRMPPSAKGDGTIRRTGEIVRKDQPATGHGQRPAARAAGVISPAAQCLIELPPMLSRDFVPIGRECVPRPVSASRRGLSAQKLLTDINILITINL